VLAAGIIACLAIALHAQQSASRIPEVIDEHNLVTLHGNVQPQARAQNDQGQVAGNLPMRRMLLVLKRGDAQETALKAAIQAMHDPKSPQYHKWLTPAQFGRQYGPSDADVAKVAAWLKGHGFQINSVAQGRGSVEFSGTADTVASSFHTQIHSYVVKGVQHYANATDPKIPAALTPVVSGILSLHNFVKQSSARILGQGQLSADKQAAFKAANAAHAKSDFTYTPNFTGGGSNYVGPGDLWTIYNATPLITAAQSRVDGTGQTIAIVGRSDVNSGDIKGFRSFLLPAPYSSTFPFTQIQNGPDPGLDDDQVEQTLDVEYSAALAPGAQIDLVVSGSTNTTDGVDLSAQYIVDNNLAPVMSTSYGLCEASLGTGNDFYNALWEQAAAQGITSMVAAGDNGSAGCDAVGPSGNDNLAYVADEGLQVSGLASTPYNVAVGGNEFTNDSSTYWNSKNTSSPAPFTSALSYVPEKVWNESCSPLVCGNASAEIPAGSGGASGCFNPTLNSDGSKITSCSGGYAMPDWQSGVDGLPTDGKRHLPDVSLTAAGHDGYMVCIYGSCDSSGFYAVGGTSASSPSFAGVMALVNQKTGSRQGQANYTLYRLAGSEFGTTDSPNSSQLASCNASNGNSVGASCIFHDVTTGSNAVPCDGGTLNCDSTATGEYGVLTGYAAETGYDSATGLGSVNVTNLVNHWNDFTPAATATTLSLGAATSTFGSPVNISVGVQPATGTGTPSGTVALITDSALPGAVGAGTVALTSGSYSGAISSLPGGSYDVSARYSGDSSFATSTSTGSKITVAPAASSVKLTITGYDPIAQTAVTGSTLPYGSVVSGSVALGGVSGQVAPSGTVTFYNGTAKLTGIATAADGTVSYSASGYAIGTYSWTASFAGNSNYNASASSPVSFAVGQAPTTLRMSANTSYVVGSNSATLTAIVTDDSLLSNPTGSVIFTINGKAAGTVPVAAYTDLSTGTSEAKATFTVDSSVLVAGVNTITAAFGGDGNYTASTSPTLSLGYGTTNAANTIALAVTPVSPQVGQLVTLAATVTTGGIPATAGTVQFYDGANAIGTAQVAGSLVATGRTTGVATLTMIPGPGSHAFKAEYLGILAAPAAVVSAPVSSTVSGSLLTSLTIAGAHNTSNSANYDLTGTVSGYGFAVPSAAIDFAETSVATDLGSVSVDATTAAHTMTAPAYMTNGDTSGASPSQALLVDLNGDGILDMATSNASFSGGTMSVLIGNGDGTFKTPTTYATNAKFTYAISSGDFNNDGIVDLAVTSQYDSNFNPGSVEIFLGNGDGTFKLASTVSMAGYPVSTAIADYNRDGVLDIASLQFIPGQISVAYGNGDGTFQKPVNYAVTAGFGSEYNLVAGDFNGDGVPDLVESNAGDNNLGLFLNNGDGTFGSQITVNTPNPEWITVADLNSDGKQDLLISNYGNQTMGVLLGNGDGTFKTEVDYPLNGYAASLALADMDGDGKLDAVAGFYYPQIGTGILKGSGDGTFGAETDYATGQGHGDAISVADLNGDGTPDMVSADISSGDPASQRIAVLLNITKVKATLSDVAIAGPATVVQQVQGVYSGDSNYAASSSAEITVNGSGGKATPSILWSPATPWGTGVALGSNVLNAVVNGHIAGGFIYTAQSGSGSATIITTASTLTAGTYTLTATFTPVDTTDYATATATRTLVVQQADFALETSATALTITAGSSGTVNVSVPQLYGFSGTVALSGGTSLPGGFTITASPATISAGGSSTITIHTTGLGSTSASTAGRNAIESWIRGGGFALSLLLILPMARRRKSLWIAMVALGVTFGVITGCGGTSFSTANVALTSGATKAASGSSVTLTATVSSKHRSQGGNVTFYNGSTALGAAVPVAADSATLSITNLPVGLNSLTAVYSGDSHNSSATSAAVAQLITGQTQVTIQGASGSETHATTVQITLQ
jgi:subtilase family serine protease